MRRNKNNSNIWIPFADIMIGILGIFIICSFLLLLAFNVPSPKKDFNIKSPGTITVSIFWKEPVDVDLWIKSPDDEPIYYNRKQGKSFNLLRDDRGLPYEAVDGMHFENAYARKLVDGTYIINLNMFSNGVNVYPIDVAVEVSIVEGNGSSPTEVIKTHVSLFKLRQELTVVQFDIVNGALDTNSINENQTSLIGAS